MNILEKFDINIEKIIKWLKDKNWNPFLEKKDIIVTKRWHQLQIKCPFHKDNSPSMWINKDKNVYNCFVCWPRYGESKVLDKNKSIWKWTFLQFLKVYYEQVLDKFLSDEELSKVCEIKENEKQEFLKLIHENKDVSNFKKEKWEEKEKKLKFSILDEYKGDSSFLDWRLLQYNDISIERLEEVKEFFLLKSLDDWTIVIPIIKDWNLVWLYWRRNQSDWKAKYYNIESFKKTNIIYNWDETINNKSILLVEGPLNAIRLWSLGYQNVVSFFWALPYKEQIDLLKEKEKIFVWFDDDEAGNIWRKELRKWLPNTVEVFELKTEWKKDAFDFSKDEIKDLFTKFKKI